MKKTGILILWALMAQIAQGQNMGNVNYQEDQGNINYERNKGNINYNNVINYPDSRLNLVLSPDPNVLITVKGMSNIKADAYVAIFSLTQYGKTPEEVNRLLDERIQMVSNKLQSKPDLEVYTDMITFVPVYEFEEDKKIFSKKTYNELPKGFELKKNLHIRYKNPETLKELITLCSEAEIYDIVKVDYYSANLEASKKELIDKAKVLLTEKLKNYQEILGTDFSTLEKQLVEGFKILYPVEMYRSYQAFASSSLNLKKSANINQADKSTTFYYQPIMNKDFDFVVNPVVVEPVIQVIYEIKLMVSREKAQAKKVEKEYYIITPNGELKNLGLE